MNKIQIKEFADELCIDDIKKYISEHLDEFEQFKNEEIKEIIKSKNS